MKNFIKYASEFIQHLTERGHTLTALTPHLWYAATIINNSKNSHTQQQMANNDNNMLYIHWTYHPNGIQQQDIHNIYNHTLQGINNFEHMTIAISHPKNLWDIMMHTALMEPDNQRVSVHMLLQHLPNAYTHIPPPTQNTQDTSPALHTTYDLNNMNR